MLNKILFKYHFQNTFNFLSEEFNAFASENFFHRCNGIAYEKDVCLRVTQMSPPTLSLFFSRCVPQFCLGTCLSSIFHCDVCGIEIRRSVSAKIDFSFSITN